MNINASLEPEPCVQVIEWLGLKLRVPRDWDIVEHGLNPMRGRLSFADRREQRFQLRWTRCKKPPLIQRMLDDYRSAQLEDEPDAKFDEFVIDKRWHGLARPRPASTSGVMSRALCYDPEHETLLEAIVTQPDHSTHEKTSNEWLVAFLKGVGLMTPGEKATRWQAFGLQIETPDGFRVESVEAQAGRVVFHFEHLKEPGTDKLTGGTATLAKLGLADAWFDGDLEKVLELKKNHYQPAIGEAVLSSRQTGCGQAAALSVVAGEPGPRLKRWMGQLRTRRDLLWHCPASNSVLHIATHSREKSPIEPLDFMLMPADFHGESGLEAHEA